MLTMLIIRFSVLISIMRLATGIEFAVANRQSMVLTILIISLIVSIISIIISNISIIVSTSSIIISKVSILNTWFSAPQKASHSLVMLSNS